MSKSFEKYQKRRLRASYFSVIISITLVLFLVGILGLIVLKYQNLSNYFKEKVTITLYLNDSLNSKDQILLEKTLKSEKYLNSLSFIPKEQAAKDFSKDIGEEFLTFLGDNPLKSFYEVHLKADFVTSSDLIFIKKDLEKNKWIDEVAYDAPLVHLLTKNIQTVGSWLLGIAIILAIIAVLLLNSSIRLSIYAKRFTIKTMQMVGATKSFIRKPFILKSMTLGIIGAFLAILILILICFKINDYLPMLQLMDVKILGIVVGGTLLAGILITVISAFFATQKFLKLKTDQLYI